MNDAISQQLDIKHNSKLQLLEFEKERIESCKSLIKDKREVKE